MTAVSENEPLPSTVRWMPVADASVGVKPPRLKSSPLNSSPASSVVVVVLVSVTVTVSAPASNVNSAMAETGWVSELLPVKMNAADEQGDCQNRGMKQTVALLRSMGAEG